MKNYSISLFTFFIMLYMAACTPVSYKEENQVTRRIQYDVSIKTPEPDFDWWMQNIEGPSREKLVGTIMEAVFSGKVKAYDCISYELLTRDKLADIQGRTDTLTLEKPDNPGEFYDTIVKHALSLKEITRLRFMEEWYMDSQSLKFEKQVVGICPLVARYTDNGEFRGYSPLFWVFYNKQYPALLKQSQ